ncbi:YitT family protein [Tabrizicola sp. TH137]|uniref:YitT family protein n=1 Tax=Tabrizicola sp. TH137 TaxID=2067452 RepID=UPI001304736E|nr:YitT family protein [Tabrizicola sp. TH137]
MTDPRRHSVLEDIQGIAFGIIMAALGIHILTHMGFATGQTTGLAVLLAYTGNLPFSLVYFLINLPFLALGWWYLGRRFALKTLITTAALSVLTDILPRWMTLGPIEPAFAALLFGILFGIAALAVVRHGGSFGGFSIPALILQNRFGIQAGYTQLAVDIVIFSAAALILDPETLLWSFLGAATYSLFLAINHRRDRYIAA